MEFNESTCTMETSKVIKAIEKDCVNKICSGQVVLSLAVAVKELVENSLDAGAKLIEVKLRKHGLESIEVVDDGSGVKEENFDALAAKHHTSKLREFEDLRSIDTFGFRGEALSSLCALCDVVITTRHTTATLGTKLEFDKNGKINSKTSCARTIGTTVLLTNIFGTLPVRQRELSKNIKVEFNKICQILRAYCLVATGVRIICSNQNNKGICQTILCTRGSDSVLKNIEDIYGAKQTETLMEIKQVDECDEEQAQSELDDLNNSLNADKNKITVSELSKFKIQGWISSCEHGHGNKLKDRQYFFVNSRPCDPKQVVKAVNEIYHRYNSRESPFVYLNILTPKVDVDINLTPDKRQLLVNNEKILILAVKLALARTFKNIQNTFNTTDTIHQVASESRNEDKCDEDVVFKSSQETFKEVLSQWKATGSTDNGKTVKTEYKRKQTDEITTQKLKLAKIQRFLESNSTESNNSAHTERNKQLDSSCFTQVSKDSTLDISTEAYEETIAEKLPETDKSLNSSTHTSPNNNLEQIKSKHETLSPTPPSNKIDSTDKDLFYDDEKDNADLPNKTLGQINISVTIEDIEKLTSKEDELEAVSCNKAKLKRLKFKAEINPAKNKNAEDELNRGITKDMFGKMEIIGQYNLGFIIVKLEDDLFIVDQHATDEMYNFEMLYRSAELQNQKLTIPQTLEFTTVNEMILMDNLEVFKANGFEFLIDNEAPATHRVKLLTKPFSKNWEFGKNDIDELIFMLHDAPSNTMCRPSRIRAMFASRACRKSVMIGTALKIVTMRQLVNHMGDVENPWNCPHGRPTMRHLVNITMLRDDPAVD